MTGANNKTGKIRDPSKWKDFLLYGTLFATTLSFCYLDFLPNLGKIIGSLAVIFCSANIVIGTKKSHPSKYALLLISFFATLCLSSLINSESDIRSFIYLAIRTLGLTFCIEKNLSSRPQKTINALAKVLQTLVLINFLTIIFFPNGMYSTSRYETNWFFMYDNTHFMWYLAAILTSVIDQMINNKKRIVLIVLLIITSFCTFYCMSATSVVAYVFLLINLFILLIRKKPFLTYGKRLIAYLFANYLIIYAQIQRYFEWFIVGILGKGLTFTGRTTIWERTIELISQKPILGYGFETTNFSKKLGSIFYTHAHNTILDIFYKGGIIAIIFFILMLLEIGNCIKKCSDKLLAGIISASVSCCFIVMLLEAREDKIGLYIVFVIAANINSLLLRKGVSHA